MNSNVLAPRAGFSRARAARYAKRAAKRAVAIAVAVYLMPIVFLTYVSLGLLDFVRNKRRTLGALDRYFAGNGLVTWILCPFNLLMDVISLPYWNKGIYTLADLPAGYQEEILDVMETAQRIDLVQKLETRLGDNKRGMIFFKWYGKNVKNSADISEFHSPYKYIRTVGVSIFSSKQSTAKHYGPLRITLRVLYTLNEIKSRQAYIKVGNQTNYWQENRMFIFDDTLLHKSCNESDEVRYCMFVDILRPSLFPALLSGILAFVRVTIGRFNSAFYQHWEFIK